MTVAGAEDIRKHVRVYIAVFATLAMLTVATVAASFLDVSTAMAIAVALTIAVVKGSLVAAYFMHLVSERVIIGAVLVLCAVFFLVLLLLPVLTQSEMAIAHVA